MRRIDRDVELWVHGNCYVAALALHRATGWELGGLTAVRSTRRGAQMAHAWVKDPSGRLWDAGGLIDAAEIHAEFITEREKPVTHETARFETWSGEADYMTRHLELAGDWADECRSWFASLEEKAEAMVRDVLLPRHPELAEAARRHAEKTDPWCAESEIEPEPIL
ncbi:hypothetical protein [Paracoccus sp. ME4]|uniref:hypothetical protein n=1 Tax=Paracoccus sp. ME4 TaxID=3138066 RepID=UPI00398B4350